MKLPKNILPLLEQVRANIPLRDVPLDFWQIDSGPHILDGFMELASALQLSDLEEEDVPHGYVVLTTLFSWEAECQFDGWTAFDNVADDEFERICEFFKEVGLPAEAISLTEQMRVYCADPDDAEALYEICSSTEHSLSRDLDRLEYLTQYFCDHADSLLYVED